jgi:hypothetical protein
MYSSERRVSSYTADASGLRWKVDGVDFLLGLYAVYAV